MGQFKKERVKNKKGFTLIELIVVMAILGILSAILVPSFTHMTTKSRFNADLNTIKHVQTQIELYMAEHDNNFPGLAKGEVPTKTTPIEGKSSAVVTLVDQGYLKESDVVEGLLDLQSRKDGVRAAYKVTGNVGNAALAVSEGKLDKIKATALEGRDKKWIVE